MTTLTRRKALAAVAIAPAALAAFPAQANDGENARDLWWRYIEANVAYASAADVQDYADCAATEEISKLECPWVPDAAGEWQTVQSHFTDKQTLFAAVKTDTTKLDDGTWLVREFRPQARSAYRQFECAEKPIKLPGKTAECDYQWQRYPGTNSAGEALDASKQRAIKEWRSWRGRASAIVRKHRVRPLETERDSIFDARCLAIAQEIAETKGSCPIARAVKLALFMAFEFDSHGERFGIAQLEALSLSSLYKEAVAEGGFDPIAEWRNTPGM